MKQETPALATTPQARTWMRSTSVITGTANLESETTEPADTLGITAALHKAAQKANRIAASFVTSYNGILIRASKSI